MDCSLLLTLSWLPLKLLNKVRSGVGFLPNLVARKNLYETTCWWGDGPLQQENFWVQVSSGNEKNTHITTPKKKKPGNVKPNKGGIYIRDHIYIYTIEEGVSQRLRPLNRWCKGLINPSFSSPKMC